MLANSHESHSPPLIVTEMLSVESRSRHHRSFPTRCGLRCQQANTGAGFSWGEALLHNL